MKKVGFKRMKCHEDGVTYTVEREKGHEIEAHGLRFFVTSEKATRGYININAYDADTGYLESKRTKEQYEAAIARVAERVKLGFDYPLNP